MYVIKWDEVWWSLGVAVVTYLLQYLVDFDPVKVTDWKVWAIALGAGLVRVAVATGLMLIGKAKVQG